MKTLLLTWWTGYIGSHNAVLFLEQWYDVIIFDNLSNSDKNVLKSIEKITGKTPKFYQWDLRNLWDIEKVFSENDIDSVIHFAGLKSVWESCDMPQEYYENNIIGTMNLTKIMEKYDCKDIIFSSSATVYEPNQVPPFSETTHVGNTTNPYGTSKFIIENILRDLATHKDFHVVNLRYFNPIWAHTSGLIWEKPNDIPNNLLPYILKVASWELSTLSIYGNDYNTIDWTWLRDYIHVSDLATGHFESYKWMNKNMHNSWFFEVFNLWTWEWTSVLKMLEIAKNITWKSIPHQIKKRRNGDIASAYCNPQKAEKVLWWKSQKTVKEAIADSWKFITIGSK